MGVPQPSSFLCDYGISVLLFTPESSSRFGGPSLSSVERSSLVRAPPSPSCRSWERSEGPPWHWSMISLWVAPASPLTVFKDLWSMWNKTCFSFIVLMKMMWKDAGDDKYYYTSVVNLSKYLLYYTLLLCLITCIWNQQHNKNISQ